MSKIYDGDWELPDEDPFTAEELKLVQFAVVFITSVLAWWTRTYVPIAMAIVASGTSVSIWLIVYQFLLEGDRRDEEDLYGWEEDDD